MDKGTPQTHPPDDYHICHNADKLTMIRRITERGLKRAQYEMDNEYCDIFQHILDEITR